MRIWIIGLVLVIVSTVLLQYAGIAQTLDIEKERYGTNLRHSKPVSVRAHRANIRLASLDNLNKLAGRTSSPRCLRDDRVVHQHGKTKRLQSFLCRLKNDGLVRIEIHRLSETVTSSIVAGKPWRDIKSAIGPYRTVSNKVLDVPRELLRKFGKKFELNSDMSLFVAPRNPTPSVIEVPVESFNQWVAQNTNWPRDYNMYYGGGTCYGDEFSNGNSPGERAAKLLHYAFDCIVPWRHMKRRELLQVPADLLRIQKRLAGNEKEWAKSAAMWRKEANVNRYAEMLLYLGQKHWPSDWLVLAGVATDGCGGFDFKVVPREMVLEVAIVRNLSDRNLSIDDLIGSHQNKKRLRRPMRAGDDQQDIRLGQRVGRLAPQEQVLIPLRTIFTSKRAIAEEFGTFEQAKSIYKRLMSTPRGTLFRYNDTNQSDALGRKIGKYRESYKRPVLPKPKDYVWGAETLLSGFVIDGERLSLKAKSSNFLNVTVGTSDGSCPILSMYDKSTGDYLTLGKVIHTANSKGLKTTEKIHLPGFSTRFRLHEEELEMALIDAVVLNISLADGRKLKLAPDIEDMSKTDGKAVPIYAGEAVIIDFHLPQDVKESDVITADLEVTGYYQRYSGLLRY